MVDNNQFWNTQSKPALQNYKMGQNVPGSWDGIRFKAGPLNYWKAPPQTSSLLPQPVYVPQGHPLPLKHEEQPMYLPKDSMFMFGRNKASPYCKSSFSTSTGQVCTTEQQYNFIGLRRGNNKNFNDDNF